jgi:hypothetical protein
LISIHVITSRTQGALDPCKSKSLLLDSCYFKQ